MPRECSNRELLTRRGPQALRFRAVALRCLGVAERRAHLRQDAVEVRVQRGQLDGSLELGARAGRVPAAEERQSEERVRLGLLGIAVDDHAEGGDALVETADVAQEAA